MRRRPRHLRSALIAALVLGCNRTGPPVVTLAVATSSARAAPPPPAARDLGDPPVVNDRIAWVPYDAERLALERRRGRPVLLNFSAAWAMASVRDEQEILETPAVRAALRQANVAPVRVDVTDENEDRERLLESFGLDRVPAYVLVAPDGARDVLPRPLSVETLVAHLAAARSHR